MFGNTSAGSGGGGLSLRSSRGTDPRRRLHDLRQPLDRYQRRRGWGSRPEPNHPARLENTIVAGNSADAGGADLDGPIDAAFDIVGNPSGATLTETVPGSDLISVNPQLGPLGDNGGPTQTMAITATSPAVNRGAGVLATDQRGAGPPRRLPGRAVLRRRGRQRRRHRRLRAAGTAPRGPLEPVPLRQGEAEQEKGTATVAVIVPGPGTMRLVGSKKVKKATKTAKIAGTVKAMFLKAKGKALRSLNSSGKAKVKAKFTLATTGKKAPASKTKVVKLIRNP